MYRCEFYYTATGYYFEFSCDFSAMYGHVYHLSLLHYFRSLCVYVWRHGFLKKRETSLQHSFVGWNCIHEYGLSGKRRSTGKTWPRLRVSWTGHSGGGDRRVGSCFLIKLPKLSCVCVKVMCHQSSDMGIVMFVGILCWSWYVWRLFLPWFFGSSLLIDPN